MCGEVVLSLTVILSRPLTTLFTAVQRLIIGRQLTRVSLVTFAGLLSEVLK